MLSALGKAEDSLRKLICLRKLSIKFIFKFCFSTRFVVGNSFFGLTQQQQNNNNNELNVRRQETFSKTTYAARQETLMHPPKSFVVEKKIQDPTKSTPSFLKNTDLTNFGGRASRHSLMARTA